MFKLARDHWFEHRNRYWSTIVYLMVLHCFACKGDDVAHPVQDKTQIDSAAGRASTVADQGRTRLPDKAIDSGQTNRDLLDPQVVTGIQIGKHGGRLVLSALGNPKTFNPLLGNESSSNIYLTHMFAPCWGFHNGRQEEEPGLCESYSRSPDGLTYTFHLRRGLRWSDGHPLTTDDFEFSYQVIMDPKIPNSDIDMFRQGKDAKGNPRYPTFKKLDALRFQFTLHTAEVLFQNTGGNFAVIPKHVWADAYASGQLLDTMSTSMNLDKLVGSGPFIVREFERDRRVLLRRNEHYWRVDTRGNRLPYLDEAEFLISSDLSVSLSRFENGDTHLHDVRAGDYERLKDAEKASNSVVMDLGPSFNTHYLMLNLDPGRDESGTPFVDPVKLRWFKQPEFRAAISHAIDRNGIVRQILGGRGEPLWSYISPANRRWYPQNVKKYEFDLKAAAECLNKIGFKKSGDSLVDERGQVVKFTIITPAENDMRVAMMNLVRRDLRKLGMAVEIQPMPFNDIVQALRVNRKFEAVMLGWGTSSPPDPAFSRNVLASSGQDHYWYPQQSKPHTKWEASMDALLSKSLAVTDYAQRKSLSDGLFRIFSEYQPQIQLVVTHDAAAARKNVGNFSPSALRPKTHWNIESLFLRR
ncbi:MAG: ABC transporter substrate-binding protein [Bradymonadia bacterium]